MNKMTKKGMTTLALAGVMALAPSASLAVQFTDVPATHWAHTHIDKLSNLGIVKGYLDHTFRPDHSVSFLEVFSLLEGVSGYTAAQKAEAVRVKGYIPDAYEVPEWAREAISVALQAGYLTEGNLKQAYLDGMIGNGGEKDLKMPSRQVIAIYVAKAIGVAPEMDNSNLKYKDLATIGLTNDAKVGNVDVLDYLSGLVKAGIYEATGSDGNFLPKKDLERDELTKIMDKSYDYVARKAQSQTLEGTVVALLSLNGQDTLTFSDKKDITKAVKITGATKITKNGKTATKKDIAEGQKVNVTAYGTGGDLTASEVRITSEELNVKGVVQSVNNGILTIAYTTKDVTFTPNDKMEKTEQFILAANVTPKVFGKEIQVSQISPHSYVEFEATDNTITALNVYPKSSSVVGKITNMSGNLTWTVEINGKSFTVPVANEAYSNIWKALQSMGSDLNKDLQLSFKYNQLVDVSTPTILGKNSGILTNVYIDQGVNPSLLLYINDGSKDGSTYRVSSDVEYSDVHERFGNNYSLQEIARKLGAYNGKALVQLTLTNGQVTEIHVAAALKSASPEYGFVEVSGGVWDTQVATLNPSGKKVNFTSAGAVSSGHYEAYYDEFGEVVILIINGTPVQPQNAFPLNQ